MKILGDGKVIIQKDITNIVYNIIENLLRRSKLGIITSCFLTFLNFILSKGIGLY